jgi:hypothetical protein
MATDDTNPLLQQEQAARKVGIVAPGRTLLIASGQRSGNGRQ